jgi:hypothetical protein
MGTSGSTPTENDHDVEVLTSNLLPEDVRRVLAAFTATKAIELRDDRWDVLMSSSTSLYLFDPEQLYIITRDSCHTLFKNNAFSGNMGRLILRVVELIHDASLLTSTEEGVQKQKMLLNGLTLIRVFSSFIMEVTVEDVEDVKPFYSTNVIVEPPIPEGVTHVVGSRMKSVSEDSTIETAEVDTSIPLIEALTYLITKYPLDTNEVFTLLQFEATANVITLMSSQLYIPPGTVDEHGRSFQGQHLFLDYMMDNNIKVTGTLTWSTELILTLLNRFMDSRLTKVGKNNERSNSILGTLATVNFYD